VISCQLEILQVNVDAILQYVGHYFGATSHCGKGLVLTIAYGTEFWKIWLELWTQVVPGFRVRIIPVLGTIPAIFGQVMASYVVTHIAGMPVPMEPVVNLDVEHYGVLHHRLIEREEILYGTAAQVEVLIKFHHKQCIAVFFFQYLSCPSHLMLDHFVVEGHSATFINLVGHWHFAHVLWRLTKRRFLM
jgi:hypothetical protein